MLRQTALSIGFLTAGLMAWSTASFGQSGDVTSGERLYRQCAVCHDVITPSGERLAGRGTNAGPNLYGIVGNSPGVAAGYRYSTSLIALGQTGMVWDNTTLVAYLLDPIGFTRRRSGQGDARSNMSFRLTSRQDAQDVVAYLISLSD